MAGGVPHTHQQAASAPLQPTFHGYIATTMDALVLFEACLSGRIAHVPRRPHDRERTSLICSGNVFIYEEHSSGIKRWTDGVPWSPSRILGNFLLYRELDKPFQPGEKKRAMKKAKENGVSKQTSTPRSSSVGFNGMMGNTGSMGQNVDQGRDVERALVGSLIDSYQFKHDGLVKKTISVQHRGMQHHMVSYYNLEDVVSRKLRTPMESPELAGVTPRGTLISASNFRAPVDDHEMIIDDRTRQWMTAPSDALGGQYAMSAVSRSMSMPTVQGYNAWSQTGHYMPSNTWNQTSLPPPNYHTTAAYPAAAAYDASAVSQHRHLSTHGQAYPSAMVPLNRRHSTVYETNGSSHNTYSQIPSMSRTHLLPSSASTMGGSHGMSHGSFTNAGMYESPAASAGSSQHGAVYENNSTAGRTSAGYDTTSGHQQTSSFATQLGSNFDSGDSNHAAGDYEAGLPGQTTAGSFDANSDEQSQSIGGGIKFDHDQQEEDANTAASWNTNGNVANDIFR